MQEVPGTRRRQTREIRWDTPRSSGGSPETRPRNNLIRREDAHAEDLRAWVGLSGGLSSDNMELAQDHFKSAGLRDCCLNVAARLQGGSVDNCTASQTCEEKDEGLCVSF